jgi:hypothetical protein
MDARASTTASRRAMVCALFVFAVGLIESGVASITEEGVS